MGHIHLGVLPRSKKWREVVDLLGGGAAEEVVIAASALTAERELRAAADDPQFVEAVRLLAMIPLAAKATDFGRALREVESQSKTVLPRGWRHVLPTAANARLTQR